MAENVQSVGWEIFWISFGTAVGFAFLIAAALHYRLSRKTPSMPVEPTPTTREAELTHPPGTEPRDKPGGHVMSFNKHVEESDGGITPLGWVVLIGIPLWWLLYLIIYWGRDLTALPNHLLPF